MRLRKGLWAVVPALTLFTIPALAQPPADGAATPADAKPADTPADGAKPPDGENPADETPPAAADAKPAASAADSGTPPGADTPIDGATYAVRLRDLEQRIDELKEQVRRSHTRLSLLSDTILSGGVGGARAEIKFKNEMSNAFRLIKALFVLDGAVQYNKQDDSGALAEQKEIPIFTGSVPTGDHTLQVLISLRGHGYGVFSYLRGYKFEVRSSHSFTVTEGKTIELDAIAWEKGGITTPLEQRPGIRYIERLKTGTGPSSSAPAPGQTNNDKNKSGASGSFSIGTGGK